MRKTTLASAPTRTTVLAAALTTILMAALATSCRGQKERDRDPDGSPPPATLAPGALCFETPIDPATACSSWRWIGLKRDGERDRPCPEPNDEGWRVRPLFAEDEGGLSRLPPALRPFCLYENPQRGADLSELAGPDRPLARIDRDCAVLGASGDDVTDALWPSFARQFLAEAGQGPAAPAAAVATLRTAPRARLVVVDTQPTAEGVPASPGRSRHGFTLAHLARQLLCGDGECPISLATRLAMPIVRFDPEDPTATVRDEVRGGFFGSLHDLATAVYRETAKAEAGERLVLNLSLGWDGALFGGSRPEEVRVEAMPARVQAVYRALEVAACRGVLVVAAAGNRGGSLSEAEGPLLPAGWEGRPAPDLRACTRILGERPPAKSGGPLVYAAGGVRTTGADLANARPGATPPRVAYGDHAVVTTSERQRPTAITTGSSVGAAVVAAAATAVWAFDSSPLPRQALMEVVDASGIDLKRPADFPAGAGNVRRIAVCPAITHACGRTGSGCGAVVKRLECGRWLGVPPSLPTAAAAAAAPTQDDVGRLGARSDFPPCPNPIAYDPSAVPANLCPLAQAHTVDTHPWTTPQPEETPCPPCTMGPGGGDVASLLGPRAVAVVAGPAVAAPVVGPAVVGLATLGAEVVAEAKTYDLLIEIPDQWNGGTLTDTTVLIGDQSFALGLTLEAGDSVLVKGFDAKLLAADPPVAVTFQTAFGSALSPVLVSQ